jgi:hypothetical protein
MAWSQPMPTDTGDLPKEVTRFQREVWSRLRAFGAFTWDPPDVSANTTLDTVVSAAEFAEVRAGMAVSITPPATITNGLTVLAWSATNATITIRLCNTTGGAINDGSATWAFTAMQVT